jgi:hypothetical protein
MAMEDKLKNNSKVLDMKDNGWTTKNMDKGNLFTIQASII